MNSDQVGRPIRGGLFRRWDSFMYGFTLPFHAGRLIVQKRPLVMWSLLPILITMIIYFYFITTAQEYVAEWLRAQVSSWHIETQTSSESTLWSFVVGTANFVLRVVGWMVLMVGYLSVWVAAALTFSLCSSIVASPFNDFLAEKAEVYALPPLPPVTNQAFTHKLWLIWIDLAKAVAAGAIGLFAILFSWVPVLNLVAFVLAFLLICFQYTSYAQTRRGVGFRDGARFLWARIYSCSGFGAALSVCFAIPILSVFILPIAVVGGTLLVARAQRNDLH